MRRAVVAVGALLAGLLVPQVPAEAAGHPSLHASLRPASHLPVTGTVVSLDASRSRAPAGDRIASWVLSAGDGTIATRGRGAPRRLQHTYAQAGRFRATLTVTDVRHHVARTTTTVQVRAALAAVQGLRGRAYGGDVLLSWTPPAGATGVSVTRTGPDGARTFSVGGGVGSTYDHVRGAGAYRYAVTARGSDGVTSPAQTTEVVTTGSDPAPAAAPRVGACGQITQDTTWSGTVFVTCDVVVPAGVTLTVAPGTKVVVTPGGAATPTYSNLSPVDFYGSNLRIQVQGTLSAQGTAAQPITFDDGSQTPGTWMGITLQPGASHPVATLSHVSIAHAEGGVLASGTFTLTMTDSTVTATSGAGLRLDPAEADLVTLQRTTVRGSALEGVVITSIDATSSPLVTGTTVTGAGASALRLQLEDIVPSRLGGTTGSGNATDAVFVSGVLREDLTWPVPGLRWSPYAWDIGAYATSEDDINGLTVAAGTTLRLPAGSTVMSSTYSAIKVHGTLLAAGTASAPVHLTSFDGPARDASTDPEVTGQGIVGGWLGVELPGSLTSPPGPVATVALTHVDISYAVQALTLQSRGTYYHPQWPGLSPAGPASVALSSSTVRHSGGVLVDNADAAFSLRDSTFSASGPTSVIMDDGDLTDAPTIRDNSWSGTGGAIVTVRAPRLLPSQLTGNRETDGRPAFLAISGGLAESTTLTPAQLPWVLGQGAYGSRPLVVDRGSTLTLGPGTVVKAYPSAQLGVAGQLVAAGTSAQPVVLTSLADDSAGGDTNGDGDGTSPTTSDWAGVTVGDGSGASLPGVTLGSTQVRWATTGVSSSGTAAVSITDSEVRSTSGTGISLLGTGPRTVARVTVRDAGADGIDVISSGLDVMDPPQLSGSTVLRAARRAFQVRSGDLQPGLLMGNSSTGSGADVLAVNGTVTEDGTISSTDVPWLLSSDVCQAGECQVELDDALDVASGVTLSVSPGAAVGLQGFVRVAGSLVARGTAAQPVTFRGVPGSSWSRYSGIAAEGGTAQAPATLDLEHVAMTSATQGVSARGVVHATITDSTFSDLAYGAIQLAGDPGSTATVARDVVARVGDVGIAVSAGDAPTVTGNTVKDVTGPGLEVGSPALRPSLLGGNAVARTQLDAVELTGHLVESLTLQPGALPWVVGHECVAVDSYPLTRCDLTVDAGATLTVPTGTVLKADDGAELIVAGALTGGGTFTSITDDAVGGDTAGDGDGTAPWPGVWAGISSTGSVTLDGAQVSYASTALRSTTSATLMHAHLLSDSFGVAGPSSGTDCVDARNTFWGDATGPAPTGHGAGVSGCVTTDPVATS